MGYMNWIYSMVEDGSYASFKKLYKAAEKSGTKNFIWASETIDTQLAKHICEFVDSYLMNLYEEHIESMIDNYYESQYE